jgi:cytidylate kinase
VTAFVVTISASYGAGGTHIGPGVAKELGVPFLDRAIPAIVAESLAVPLKDAVAHDERREGRLHRVIAVLAHAGTGPFGRPDPMPAESPRSARDFRDRTENTIREMADTTGGVILGRAATVVLRDHANALHIRLDGPVDARVRQAVRFGDSDEENARRHLEDTDRVREDYIKHFYRIDPRDPALYHLVIDSTALDFHTCIELIVAAARARAGADEGPDAA